MVSSVNLGAANYFSDDCASLAFDVHGDMTSQGFSHATASAAADAAYKSCKKRNLSSGGEKKLTQAVID